MAAIRVDENCHLDESLLNAAAQAIAQAEGLVIAAGAGMGVDSGLPDFRGNEGFWRAYPPYAQLGLSFVALAHPSWFQNDPELAWGFYGHRLHLYRDTTPHSGFHILRRWAQQSPLGGFVFTSNVDGQFQRAGFADDQIREFHGSIHWLQCLPDCGQPLFSADRVAVVIDPATMRARQPLPSCPACGGLARPNILMFGDGGWNSSRADQQAERGWAWLRQAAGRRLVIVELGAGQAVATVRNFCERLANASGAKLIRINPRDCDGPRGSILLPSRARAALEAIDARLEI